MKWGISVNWSNEDDAFVATSQLYPSLSWIEDNADAAYDGLLELIYQIEEEQNEGQPTI